MDSLAFMQRNEIDANKKVAKICRITIGFLAFLLILDFVGLFKVNYVNMTVSCLAGAAILFIPTLLTNILKLNHMVVKYIDILACVSMVSILYVNLTYHIVIIFIFPVAVASIYFSKKVSLFAAGSTIIGTTIVQLCAINIVLDGLGQLGLPTNNVDGYAIEKLHASGIITTIFDRNQQDLSDAILFAIIPRAICLLCLTAIFIALGSRTAKLLENVLSAEEQASLFDKLKDITAQSKTVSHTLIESVTTLEQNAHDSESVNNEIAISAANVTEASKQTVAEVLEASEHIGNISDNLGSMAEESTRLSELASNIERLSAENHDIMEVAGENMQDINDKMQESKAVIYELKTSSDEISQIVAVISGISSQTNLLALNAAIESARAGEAGRGFAVVSEEIRELSEKTKSALQNIGAIITGVLTNTDKAVEAMDESMKITASGVEIMKKAKVSTAEITTANKEMGIQIKSVNQESVQAMEMNRRLVEIVESIQVIANKNLDDMQKVYDASQIGMEASRATSNMVDKLNEVAEQLAKIIASDI